ncbi:TPA: hypothetical protein DCW38_03200 [candidate division WOR-3 bacterium]|uniref:DUF6922 domain-containing protein n=1 Tax=candidate division WOR-3 bacterium TaxID=2052148 RepID=A0A350H9F4_UNCW3|nr:hypothetical protein [candidate division WOR-3 bacterium]
MEKKGKKRESVYKYFDRVYFWDYINIKLDKHYKYIIARILDYGQWEDVRTLQKLYTKEQIIETIKTSRYLSKKTANYWAIKYKINKGEIECMKEY